MANTIVISTVEQPVSEKHPSIGKTLRDMGRTRFHGTTMRLTPKAEKDGRYRTGIDEKAIYLNSMSEQEREVELEKIRGWKTQIQESYGEVDLGPRSSFYSKIYDSRIDPGQKCPIAIFKDGDNILNLDNKEDLIRYCYLRVHDWVAPSAEALLSGQYPTARFYIKDTEHEHEIFYKRKTLVNKAKQELENLTTKKRTTIARQLGLPVTDQTKETSVYRLLDDYISLGEKKANAENITLFNKFLKMKDDNLAIMDTIVVGLEYNVIRKVRAEFMRGEVPMGKTKDEVAKFLGNPKNQMDFLIPIQEEIKAKRSIKA